MPLSTARMRTTLALASAAGLAVPLLGGAAAAAETGTPPVAAATWSRVTPAGTNIIDDIGLARGNDGVLHVLWTGDGTSNLGIMDTPISANGTVGKAVTIARFFLPTDPDATVTPTGIAAIWNGIQTSKPNSAMGTFEATRPLSGGQWTGQRRWRSRLAAPRSPAAATPRPPGRTASRGWPSTGPTRWPWITSATRKCSSARRTSAV